MQLKGKTTAITGGTRGIGYGITEGFNAEGAKVMVGSRSQDKDERALAEMSAGDSAHFIAMDAQNQSDFETFVDEATERLGQVDILVNNAGGSSGFAPIATMSNEASTSSLERKMLAQGKKLVSKDPSYYFDLTVLLR
jgi:3-hydroxybutyrate dehydrogenase/3-oxoacyl-[acyl-carrier protein] reductase